MSALSIPAHHIGTPWPRSQAPLRSDELLLLDPEWSVPRGRGRQIAVNVLGWMAIAGAVAAAGWMATSTPAQDPIAFWGSMGQTGNLVPQRPGEEIAPAVLAAPDAGALQAPPAAPPIVAVAPAVPAPKASADAGAAPEPPVASVAARQAPVARVAARSPRVGAPRVQEVAPTLPPAWQKTEAAPEDPYSGVPALPREPAADDPYGK